MQEERLHTIAIPSPKRAAPPQPHWLRPTTTFAAPEATPTPPKATPTAPTPDTHVTQTEVNGVELKKTGEEERTAQNIALMQVNAQRQRNRKRALGRADERQLAQQASAAQITPLQALQWVLARPSRNFFKADYADAAGTANAAPVAPPPRRPHPPAAPDLDTQAQIARQARAQEVKAAASAHAPAIEPHAAPLTIAGTQINGPAWATSAARQFCAGIPVSLFRIQAACSVLGVSRQALRGGSGV